MHRLFVALSLPEEITDRLLDIQTDLDGARWRNADQLHLTLAFIGDADRHGAREAAGALAAIDAPAFDLELAGVGAFGERKPRAVWAGVRPVSALDRLQAKVETALRAAGFAMEARKFTPHITLAYLSGAARDRVERYCAAHGLVSSPPFPVTEFHLFDSHLGGEGSWYEVLESYSLSFSR